MRLQRFLARAGVASRRASEKIIEAGRVTVNGEVRSDLGCKVDAEEDVVRVDGARVTLPGATVYLMLNKPAGYVTTMKDERGRPCVADLMPLDAHPGLFAVGRLDKDTTGLLLLTTDGEAGSVLLHPKGHVAKHYVALVDGPVRDEDLEPLRVGASFVHAESGEVERFQPAEAEVIAAGDPRAAMVAPAGVPRGKAVVGLTIREGHTHQVKNMMRVIGRRVEALHRDAFGPLVLTGVEEGSWRELTDAEREALLAACSGRCA